MFDHLTLLYVMCLIFCKICPYKDFPVKTSRMNSASQLSDSAGINGRQTLDKTPSDKNGPFRDYDRLKDFDALSRLSGGFRSEESIVDANSEKELVFSPVKRV